MKVSGKVWNEYLASWPEDQYFDDSDETVNGVDANSDAFNGVVPDDAVVEFTAGTVYRTIEDRVGKSLVSGIRAFIKSQSITILMCTVPNERLSEFNELVAKLSVRVAKAG